MVRTTADVRTHFSLDIVVYCTERGEAVHLCLGLQYWSQLDVPPHQADKLSRPFIHGFHR